MRTLPLLIAFLVGCAQTPAKDYDRWKRELDMQEKGETPLWATIDHPVASGWEAGVRVQAYRFYGSLSWMDRTTTLDPNNSGSADYGFEGGVLAVGLRW